MPTRSYTVIETLFVYNYIPHSRKCNILPAYSKPSMPTFPFFEKGEVLFDSCHPNFVPVIANICLLTSAPAKFITWDCLRFGGHLIDIREHPDSSNCLVFLRITRFTARKREIEKEIEREREWSSYFLEFYLFHLVWTRIPSLSHWFFYWVVNRDTWLVQSKVLKKLFGLIA